MGITDMVLLSPSGAQTLLLLRETAFPDQITPVPRAEVQLPLLLPPDEQHLVTELPLDPARG